MSNLVSSQLSPLLVRLCVLIGLLGGSHLGFLASFMVQLLWVPWNSVMLCAAEVELNDGLANGTLETLSMFGLICFDMFTLVLSFGSYFASDEVPLNDEGVDE